MGGFLPIPFGNLLNMLMKHLSFKRTTYRYHNARPWVILVLCIAVSVLMSVASRLVFDAAHIVVSPFHPETMTRSVNEQPNAFAGMTTNCRFQNLISGTCKKTPVRHQARAETRAAVTLDDKNYLIKRP